MAKRVWGESGQHSFIAATSQRGEWHLRCPSQHFSPGASLQLGMRFLLLWRDIAGWCEEAVGTTQSPGTPPASSQHHLTELPSFLWGSAHPCKRRQETCCS